MKRRGILRAAASTAAAPWLFRARAQTQARRVGVLYPNVHPGGPTPGAAQAWKRLGWIVGETLQIERRYAAHRAERMPELADELLRGFGAELILASGPEAAAAAARATRNVPIVFRYGFLPIECGLIDSYARPGRNCTGTAMLAGFEVVTKRLEFLRAAAPSLRRLAILAGDLRQFTVSGEPIKGYWADYAKAAAAQGYELTVHVARRVEDVESALTEAASAQAQAAIITGESYIGAGAERVAEFVRRQRWPSATLNPELFDAGLLIYHGLSEAEAGYVQERWLRLADRILRGANPAQIPVELPTRYEFALNLKAARAIGLVLPQSLVLRADRLVE